MPPADSSTRIELIAAGFCQAGLSDVASRSISSGRETGGRPLQGRTGYCREKEMDASTYKTVPEASIRYDGWRIVAVCFLLATFGWGLGFYGQSVYVAELQRARGWPTSLISSGTTFFYLFGALLVVFVGEAVRKYGPRICLIAGTLAMAAATVAIGAVREPWQLYLADAVLAFGWAGAMLVLLVPVILLLVGRPPDLHSWRAATTAKPQSSTEIRAWALRDLGFL